MSLLLVYVHELSSDRSHIHKVMVCTPQTDVPSHTTLLIASYFTQRVFKGHDALCQTLPVHWVAAMSDAITDRKKKQKQCV